MRALAKVLVDFDFGESGIAGTLLVLTGIRFRLRGVELLELASVLHIVIHVVRRYKQISLQLCTCNFFRAIGGL